MYAALLGPDGFPVKLLTIPGKFPDVADVELATPSVELGLVVPIPTLPPEMEMGELPSVALPV
jgi:hypothetical protein